MPNIAPKDTQPTKPAEQEQDHAAYNGWVLREVLFDNGEPIGHRAQEPDALKVAWLAGYTEGEKAAWAKSDALLRQALEALKLGCPPDCKDGVTDSGGVYPWGEAVLIPCPSCSTIVALRDRIGKTK